MARSCGHNEQLIGPDLEDEEKQFPQLRIAKNIFSEVPVLFTSTSFVFTSFLGVFMEA
jgi:hypothetical protein